MSNPHPKSFISIEWFWKENPTSIVVHSYFAMENSPGMPGYSIVPENEILPAIRVLLPLIPEVFILWKQGLEDVSFEESYEMLNSVVKEFFTSSNGNYTLLKPTQVLSEKSIMAKFQNVPPASLSKKL